MNVNLHYGEGVLTLRIPDENVGKIIRPWQDKEKAGSEKVLKRALACQERDDFQKQVVGKHICVLIGDGTREIPFGDMFGHLFPLLQKCSLVRFLICTGTHNAETPENNRIKGQVEGAATKAGICDFEIHTHECLQDRFICAGRTSRNTEVMFNAKADDAQIFLVLSDVKCHYFAGYSNPIKNFVPGICSYETTEQNHSLAIDDKSTFGLHPWHRDRNRRANPVAEDQLEAMGLIVKNRPIYALATISTLGKIQWAKFGEAEQVSASAFTVADRRNGHIVSSVERLIVSPGGLPNDVDLYIAQRALELTKNGVKNDGEILFLAACPNGVGEKQTMENFYNLLTAPIDQVLKSVESEYKLFSHKPYKLAQLLQRLRRIWMYSQIPDELVESIHLHPTKQPQVVVDSWLAEEPASKITLVDGANKIALYAKT